LAASAACPCGSGYVEVCYVIWNLLDNIVTLLQKLSVAEHPVSMYCLNFEKQLLRNTTSFIKLVEDWKNQSATLHT